ncbi:MAG: hypothetical protein H6550_10065 [Chitinophagales bacterium]|nr:hypothetical protein [Chitinophagales bacterium]
MPAKTHDHIEHGPSSWLKTLEWLRQENASLKNRLADVIKDNVSSELLEKAENFQSLFLDKDAVISLLRRDIAQFNARSSNKETTVSKEYTKLGADIARMEKEFLAVKSDFYKFLNENRRA